MNKIFPRLSIAVFGLLGWYLSGAIHELGHAGAVKLAGLEVVEIQPWVFLGKVHMQYAGVTNDA
jgi:hypothetical protein